VHLKILFFRRHQNPLTACVNVANLLLAQANRLILRAAAQAENGAADLAHSRNAISLALHATFDYAEGQIFPGTAPPGTQTMAVMDMSNGSPASQMVNLDNLNLADTIGARIQGWLRHAG
jgi:hypothetical protein